MSVYEIKAFELAEEDDCVDDHSDFHSLGATFYQLLVVQPPFEAVDVLDQVHQHVTVMPLPSHTLDDKIPAVLFRIVIKLLAKMAEDRYQNGTGLRADFKRRRHSLAAVMPPDFPPRREDSSDGLQIPQKLFGVFQRLYHANECKGPGIGLATVRRIITRHGCRTWAEEEPDQDAAFFFSLPHALQRRENEEP